ncbi:hypothetical protein GDO86_015607 [Hymenochirus boettgeri]|uniref:Uncharacterized protein n=1 Tax=Hymenochirus boettgeri TaxID=247094 RepID=A0A8T2JTK5_9PIPI|nr:hypothetical protein GDO86_015607 [Hymenochirus boettgeri]
MLYIHNTEFLISGMEGQCKAAVDSTEAVSPRYRPFWFTDVWLMHALPGHISVYIPLLINLVITGHFYLFILPTYFIVMD